MGSMTTVFICMGIAHAFYWRIAVRRAARYGCRLTPGRTSAIVPALLAYVAGAASAAHGASIWFVAFVLPGLAVCAATDLQTGYVFDNVLLAMGATLVPFLADGGAGTVIGAVTAALVLWIPYAVSRGKALGFADIKLAAVCGLAFSFPWALRWIWYSVVIAGAAGASLLVTGCAGGKSRLPFAPFLGLGAACALLAEYAA
jgi:leader peptidase (prepilin peptidase)/N-methyltransferase